MRKNRTGVIPEPISAKGFMQKMRIDGWQ